jgi:hypothetical protein
VANLLHFMTTCNNENIFKITETSRRFMYIETFNELIGNHRLYFRLIWLHSTTQEPTQFLRPDDDTTCQETNHHQRHTHYRRYAEAVRV